jgi:nucleotide-binding universal stress UspA family protein
MAVLVARGVPQAARADAGAVMPVLPGLQRVLVGVDFSAPSSAAARWARAHIGGVDIALVHVVQVLPQPSFAGGEQSAREQALEVVRTNAERSLAELAAELPEGDTMRRIVTGKPSEELVRVAQDVGADIIVVGEHGRRAGAARMLGSTAEQVLRSSVVPVLLARGLPDGPPRRIVVPIDDSDMTSAVLDWARVVCTHFGAPALLLYVVDPDLVSAVGIAASAAELRRARSQLRRSSMKWLGERAMTLEQAGVDVRLEVAFADPATRILARAKPANADLVVLGRRGAGRVQRAIVGGVADRVLRLGKTLVLVVPEPRD